MPKILNTSDSPMSYMFVFEEMGKLEEKTKTETSLNYFKEG